MNERQAFVQNIADHLYDDAPRLVFADWLDEQGEHERAEFVRVQVELEPIRDQYEIPRAAELHEREDSLYNSKQWLGEMPEGWDDWRTGLSVEFRRGFPDMILGPARSFLAFGPAIRERHPTIRRVVVHCLNGWGERLAACDGLRNLAELELACWYADEDMQALANSPHLARLEVLVLWLGRCRESTDAELVRIAAAATAWPYLRELVLLDPEGDREQEIRALAADANQLAGRDIARYERGYPELFPLNGQFYYDFPIAGRLPDGRAVVVDLINAPRHTPDAGPAEILVQYFEHGAPSGEPIRISLPPELAEIRLRDTVHWGRKHIEYLRETIGFEPGFIRVQANSLGEDFGPDRGHYDDWDHCGHPDDPEGNSEWETGYGGLIYHKVRNVEFVFRYDAWADKTGEVHST